MLWPSETTQLEGPCGVISLHCGLYPLLQFLPIAAYFLGTILGAGDIAMGKIRQDSSLLELPV